MINHDREETRARVAWIAAGARGVPPALADAARLARYDIVEPSAASDIAVVDLYGADPDGAAAADAVALARRAGAGAGVLIAADAAATSEQRRRLARLGETVFLHTSLEPLIGAVRERLRLAALAEETGDRLKSLVADGRAVSFAAPQRKEDGAVLIAGKPSPLALAASTTLRAASRTPVCVFTAGQAMRALDHGSFEGAVFIPADENDLLIALARALRRHREHRRLPVIILSADEDLLDRRAAKDGLDAMAAARASDDLARRLETMTRRANMSAAMRAFLRSPDGNGGGRGAASARLFAQHAMRVAAGADEKGRPISFVALSLSPKSGTDAAGASRALLEEALRTAGRLVRAEDMIAKLTTTTLVVMLRGTPRGDADRVARRLEGVVTGVQPRATLDLWDVRATALERAPGMEFERVIAALVASLRSRREPKSA
jgi:PleD family two-component response regulator